MLGEYPAATSHLSNELVGWLTTVSPNGQPQASAIWFVVKDDDLLVYSRPFATRLRNIAANPKVAFNLRGDSQGDNTFSVEGLATVDLAIATPLGNPAYMKKYGSEILRLGWTHEQYDEQFSTPVRIAVTRVRHMVNDR